MEGWFSGRGGCRDVGDAAVTWCVLAAGVGGNGRSIVGEGWVLALVRDAAAEWCIGLGIGVRGGCGVDVGVGRVIFVVYGGGS